MNIAAEFQAALPEPHVILGLRLLPLSLGRYRLLKRFNSPFVSEEQEELSLNKICGELFFALLICGLRCDEFRSLMEAGRLEKEVKRWAKRAQKLIRKTSGFHIFQPIEQFKKYLTESTDLPWKVVSISNIDVESVSHWSHSVEVLLRSRAGWSQEEIEEEPISKALCDFFKLLESEGSVRLMSHESYAEVESFGQNNADILLKFQKEMEAQHGS